MEINQLLKTALTATSYLVALEHRNGLNASTASQKLNQNVYFIHYSVLDILLELTLVITFNLAVS